MRADRAFVLCADDFGLSDGIDAGIVDLARRGRLTATGCMVAGGSFAADAENLRSIADRLDIGLHFALTDLPTLGPVTCLGSEAGSAAPLGRVLARSLTGRLAYAEIAAEFRRQVDRFTQVVGRAPDFVDGHQHVHVFPVMRQVVLDAFDEGLLDRRTTWLRDCRESMLRIVRRGIEVPKTMFISALATGFGTAARRRGIVVNRGFGGITAFEPERFAHLFPRFLEETGRAPLIMCHPALPEAAVDPSDPIDTARRAEHRYLGSDAFEPMLATAGYRLARLRDIAAASRIS